MKQALVIDDAAMFRRAVHRMLRRVGLGVEEAADGRAGFAALSQRPVDVALVDCLMPGLSGLELIAQVRRDRRFDGVKLVLVTGLEDGNAAELALLAGADGYLVKPFNEAALVEQLDGLGLVRHVA
ncbi:MAG TPA: response regulator [Kofleriaceae bacterium]|nr:response regulator [Kofleriaceae bacterium]